MQNKGSTRTEILFRPPLKNLSNSFKAFLFFALLLALSESAFAFVTCPSDPEGFNGKVCYVACEYEVHDECPGLIRESCPDDVFTDCQWDPRNNVCENRFKLHCDRFYRVGGQANTFVMIPENTPLPFPEEPHGVYGYIFSGHGRGYPHLIGKAKTILTWLSGLDRDSPIRQRMAGVSAMADGCCTFSPIVSGGIKNISSLAFSQLYQEFNGFTIFQRGFQLELLANMMTSWFYYYANPLFYIETFQPWYSFFLTENGIRNPEYPRHYRPPMAGESRITCEEAQRITGNECNPTARGDRFICERLPASNQCFLQECVCVEEPRGEICSFSIKRGKDGNPMPYPCDGVRR